MTSESRAPGMVPDSFDPVVLSYLRQSRAELGLPERITDPDVLNEAVAILLMAQMDGSAEQCPTEAIGA